MKKYFEYSQHRSIAASQHRNSSNINYSNSRIVKMLTLLTFITSLLLFTNYSTFSQFQSNPTACNFGDTTSWQGPFIAHTFNIPSSILGCNEPGCIVKITYFKRTTSWGIETIVESIEFSGTCGYDCYANAYKTALWMLAIIYQSEMGLIDVDDCYLNFTYRMATCWQEVFSPLALKRYVACESECCVSTYNICLREGTNDIPNIEIQKIGSSSPISHNCILPCQFIDCEGSSPSYIWGPTKDDKGANFVFFPKQNISNNFSDVNIVISPNIVNNDLNITISNINDGHYYLRIYDNIGNLHISNDFQIKDKNSIIKNFDLKNMPIGKYNLIIYNNNGFLHNESFIIIR